MSTASTSPATLTGLTAETTYEVRVRAKTQTDTGDWSEVVSQTTPDREASGPAEPESVTQVTNVLVTQTAGGTDLMVAWDTQTQATSYDIDYRTGSGSWTTNTATTSPAMLTGLTASTSYQVRVRARNANGAGAWSVTATQTTPDALVSPGPGGQQDVLVQVSDVLVAQTTEPTELMVSWDLQADATGYDVEYRLTSTAPSGLWSMSTDSTSPYTITNLMSGSSYQVRVRATTQTETGDWSSVITQSTPDPVPASTLTPVANVVVTQTTEPTELMVSFDTQNDATSYDVEYRLTSTAPSGLWSMSMASTSPTTLTNLMPSSSYQIRVRATTQTEMGDWSATATQTTPDPPAPEPLSPLAKVTNVVVWRAISEGFVVEFDLQTQATSYDIEYRLLSTAPSGEWSRGTAITDSVAIKGLSLDTAYQVRVRARNATAIGEWSDVVMRTTSTTPEQVYQNVGKVTNVVATQGIDGTQLIIAYDNQQISVHHIEYRLASTAPSGLWNFIVTRGNPRTITGLSPSTSYQIRVRASVNAGDGEWSDVITAMTSSTLPPEHQIPPQVTGVSVDQGITNTNLVVLFTPQMQASYYDIAYRLTALAPHGLWSVIPTIASPTTINGLMSNTSYQVRVRARNATATGEWSNIATQTTLSSPTSSAPQILTKVTDVAVSQGTTNSELIVTFATQASATSYAVEHRLLSSAPSGAWTTLSVSSSPATITGLTANTSYQVRVRAKRSGMTGEASDIITDATSAIASPPTSLERVSGVSVSMGTTNTELVVSFQTQALATSYDVAYLVDGLAFTALNYTIIPITSSPITITGLVPNTRYQVSVRAKNSGGTGTWSYLTTHTTQSTSPILTAVNGVAVNKGTNDRELSVSFMFQSQATGYDVAYRLASVAPNGAWRIVPTTTNPTILPVLQPNTAYQVSVRARNSSEYGPWSRIVNQSTSITLIQILFVQAYDGADHTQLRLNFNTVPNATSYEVEYRTVDTVFDYSSQSQWLRVLPNPTTNTITITNLKPSAPYRIRVRAKNDTTSGPWSSNIVHTTPLMLGQVSQISVSQEMNRSVVLSFPEVAYAQNYEFRYKKSTDTGWTSSPGTFSNTSAMLSGLEAGATYDIQARARSPRTVWTSITDRRFETVYGPWSETVTATTTLNLEKVTGISAMLIEKPAYPDVRIFWNLVPDADSYHFQSCRSDLCNVGDDDNDPDLFSNYPPNIPYSANPSLVFDELSFMVGAEYNIRIRAQVAPEDGVTPIAYGPWSDIFIYTVPIQLPTPEPSVMTLNESSIQVDWSIPHSEGIIQRYEVRYAYTDPVLGNQVTQSEIIDDGDDRFSDGPITISNLSPLMAYTIDVRAGREIGDSGTYVYGDWSTAITGMTIRLSQIRITDLSFPSASSMYLAWHPESDADSYEVEYTTAGPGVTPTTTTVSPNPTTNNVTITGLSVTDTQYDSRIRARRTLEDGSVLYGEWSETLLGPSFLSKADPPTLSSNFPAYITIQWNTFTGADRYEARYRETSSSSWIGPVGLTDPSTTLVSLSPETEYEVQVRGVADQNPPTYTGMYGVWSDSATITTGEAPATPTNVYLNPNPSDQTSLEVGWDRLPELRYSIQYCRSDCARISSWHTPNNVIAPPPTGVYSTIFSTPENFLGNIYRLDINTTYQIRIRSYIQASQGDRVNSDWVIRSASTTIFDPPAAPSNVNAQLTITGVILGGTRLSVSWSPAQYAEEYEVQYAFPNIFDPSAPIDWSQAQTHTTTNANFTANFDSFLPSEATVRVRSKAIDSRDRSLYSSWVTRTASL